MRGLPDDVAAAVKDLKAIKQRIGRAKYQHRMLLTDLEVELLDQADELLDQAQSMLRRPETLF